MRATGRRIGRIVGQLEDLEVLVEVYRKEEEGDTREALDRLAYHLDEALSAALNATAFINDRTRGESK